MKKITRFALLTLVFFNIYFHLSGGRTDSMGFSIH